MSTEDSNLSSSLCLSLSQKFQVDCGKLIKINHKFKCIENERSWKLCIQLIIKLFFHLELPTYAKRAPRSSINQTVTKKITQRRALRLLLSLTETAVDFRPWSTIAKRAAKVNKSNASLHNREAIYGNFNLKISIKMQKNFTENSFHGAVARPNSTSSLSQDTGQWNFDEKKTKLNRRKHSLLVSLKMSSNLESEVKKMFKTEKRRVRKRDNLVDTNEKRFVNAFLRIHRRCGFKRVLRASRWLNIEIICREKTFEA